MDWLTPSLEVVPLDEEHDEREELVVAVHDPEEVPRVPLREDLGAAGQQTGLAIGE